MNDTYYSLSAYQTKFISNEFLPDAVQRRDVLMGKQHQILVKSNYGINNIPLEFNPVNGVTVDVTKKCNIYSDNALIGYEAFYFDYDTFNMLQKFNWPLYQSWPVTLKFKKEFYSNYFIVFFYYDYFQEIDFNKSIIMNLNEEIIMEGNFRKRISKVINDNIKFDSYREFRQWEEEHGTVSNKLKFIKLTMKDNVYNLDIIRFRGSGILVSERLKEFLQAKKISCIDISKEKHLIEKY